MVEYTVDGTTIVAETRSDLFSPKDLDKGSRLLLEAVAKENYTSLLDWGCGWGALSLWLAERRPKAQVIALDSDMGAVKQTIANAERNRLKNLEVIASPGYEDIDPTQKFNLIVSNPPTHRGREVVESMITESAKRLNKGGKFVIVVEARLKPWVDRALKESFGRVKTIKRSPKHAVLIGE